MSYFLWAFLYFYTNMHINVVNNQSKSTKQAQKLNLKPELANNLMNDVYDNFLKEDINGRQFEELFQEIAELIKTDQKERGFGMLEINNFVDDCKEILLIGFREELSNFDDFQFDENSPLFMQTQQFLLDRAKRLTNQKIQIQQDFPTLGGSSNNNKNNNKISIIEKIQRQQKKKKDQGYLFRPSKVILPHFAMEKSNKDSIFNVDNKLKSQKDLESLHKEFENFPIIDLKFVYKTFVGDINVCRQFLIRYYGYTRNNNKKVDNNKSYSASNKKKPTNVHSKRIYNNLKKEEIDQELKHLSYQQIRDELDHLFKLKQVFQLTKMKIKNTQQRIELDRIINQKQPIIAKFSYAARVLLIEKMSQSRPLYVDLHGFREEEVDRLLDAIEGMIRYEFERGNDKIKVKKVQNNLVALLTIMTGKGLHSKGSKSVLKPAIASWCLQKGLQYEQEIDQIRVQFILN